MRPEFIDDANFSVITGLTLVSALESTNKPLSTGTTADPAQNSDPPIAGATFANACYEYIHNFTFSAIVLHNMDPEQARKWHRGRDREQFMELAGNLTQTIMKLVEQMDQVGAMFSVRKEVPTEMYNAPTRAAEKCPQTDESSVAVPLMSLVLLALVLYIGFLSHQIKTK